MQGIAIVLYWATILPAFAILGMIALVVLGTICQHVAGQLGLPGPVGAWGGGLFTLLGTGLFMALTFPREDA